MKRIYLSILVLCLALTQALAQQARPQALADRVTDLLVKVPTPNSQQLQKNMEDMAALGQDGLVLLASRLRPPGQGDNARIEYALGGFTYYVTQPGREDWRKLAATAYGQALAKVSDAASKNFLIFQLQQVGKAESVPVLSTYLGDKDLCGSAARALARIATPEAGKALTQSLTKATGTCQVHLLEALGDSRYAEAAPVVEALVAGTSDQQVRKVALYTLASLGVPSSESTLATAAQKAAYGYDPTNATASYIRYLQARLQAGDKAAVTKAAQALLKSTSGAAQVPTRTAALKLLTDSQGEAGVPTLIEAMDAPEAAYRAAALKWAQPSINAATTALWVKKLNKAKPEVQAEIIAMLGRANATEALPAVLKALNSKDAGVRLAAIRAAGTLGQANALKPLLATMQKGKPDEVAAVRQTLLTLKGPGVTEQVATALPAMPAPAQAALLDVLAARAASTSMNLVLDRLGSADLAVRQAAFAALKPIATANDLPPLFNLLHTTTDGKEVEAVQDALVAALKGTGDEARQTAQVLEKMNAANAAQKARYLRVLGGIGGKKALNAVVSTFNTGDEASQKAALTSLAAWADASAGPELYTLASQSTNSAYVDLALRGYVQSVGKFSATPENKVLMLRKAMTLAQTPAQKELILKELIKYKTFNALILAGKYLDEVPVQAAAAQAVTSIALANKAYQGDAVRDLLNKASALLKGQDSEYQKEAVRKHLADMPSGEGFVSLFNGQDLTGWKGLVDNPIKRATMHPDTLAAKQAKADEKMRTGWFAKDGELVFSGKGDNLCTVKKYGDFEMYVDWKIEPKGDAGIYLRGTPQVQVWDTSRVDVGAQVGSGGLYNNQKHPSKPLKLADNAIGDWNTFYIKMQGDRVTVKLNGELVVDNVILENYWDRKLPIFPEEQLELQAHGTLVAYRDIYVRELPRPKPFELSEAEKKEGFKVLFDGTNMHEWIGNTTDYVTEDGDLVLYPDKGGKGNLYTKDQYSDFAFRFEFQLTPGANNGLGIRAPLEGDAAYVGMEIQILDDGADIYRNLKEHQYHGSVYGVIPAKRGYLKPVGEWNYEEVIVQGSKIKVILNGTVILDGDLAEASKNGTLDQRDHPGLKRETGHIGFLGHGNYLRFRNIRVKDLSAEPVAKGKPAAKAKKK
ncbi:hypothetical protein GCM10027275_41670 [Rhabdobacter roseus]|uniref:HEAT repeat protein n=1 Tax=Rhabdobacter roseus TaxID=1655419 RepID=A0A840TS60_9BACT|nr:family 16 glycoside hydrolase [Rhabdobacter roseus]MBB5286144.1 HEAT repeat protein [Rhabdobacter roseus]